MLRIPIPLSAYSDQSITLNGQNYIFTFRFNTRSSRWKVDIYDAFENLLVAGITVVEDSLLTYHINLPDTFGGELHCVKLAAGDDRAGRINVGINKTHELVYYGDNEE